MCAERLTIAEMERTQIISLSFRILLHPKLT